MGVAGSSGGVLRVNLYVLTAPIEIISDGTVF